MIEGYAALLGQPIYSCQSSEQSSPRCRVYVSGEPVNTCLENASTESSDGLVKIMFQIRMDE